jgi:nucleoside-diphosphate-sugar epimerase
VILRPGVVLGPRETVGRLPWWLRRIAEGGDVLAPGSPDRLVQPVDVRDLAVFAVGAAERGLTGVYNVTAPVGRETFGGMLRSCADATGSGARFTWVPDEVLLSQGVRQWSEIPLWRIYPGVSHVDAGPARAAGLCCRPLAETVTGTWSWMLATGSCAGDARAGEIGMSRARERQILASLT